MNPTLEAKLKAIPHGPGVYLYKDDAGQTIYVGKAKSLRNRVRTYFQLSTDFDARKDQMMDGIEDVEFIVTDTEGEALALENNLIKQYKPKYNILRCLGPCVEGLTTFEQYQEAVKDVKLFLEGRNNDLIKRLQVKMDEASAAEQYELAAHYRDAIDTMETLAERQKMAVMGYDDIDIFGFHQEEHMVAVSVFHMRGGRVVDKRELFWEDQFNFDSGEFFQSVLKQYYVDAPFIPVEIYVPVDFEDRDVLEQWLSERRGRKVEIRTPQRGGKRELMELVHRNARLSFMQRFRAAMPSPAAISKEIEEALDLEKPPRRIECFDISNLQGSDVVASMVVWEDGRMKKADYRRFIIRSLSGQPDDFQSMREVVTRRYKRVQEEGLQMPDLVLIDGGIGQLHAAQSALDELNIVDQPLSSIAKKEEIIYIAGREDEPIILDRRSPVLRMIQQIRDESHRFAITFHRERRGRRTLTSELCEISAIGLKTTQKLLTHFGSLANIRDATVQDLQGVVNRTQAEAVWRHFHNASAD